MKRPLRGILACAMLALAVSWIQPAFAQVTLKVLNPRGEIEPPPVAGIRPRLRDLSGKRIALIDNTKAGARNFLNVVEELLKQRYPTAIFLAPPKPEGRILQDTKEWYPQVISQFDTFIFGVGD
jgi:hypothetical protein